MPTGVCDVCGGEIDLDSPGWTRVSATRMHAAVRAGYRPPLDTAEENVVSSFASAFGISSPKFSEGWAKMALANSADWALCGPCAARAHPYMPSPSAARRLGICMALALAALLIFGVPLTPLLSAETGSAAERWGTVLASASMLCAVALGWAYFVASDRNEFAGRTVGRLGARFFSLPIALIGGAAAAGLVASGLWAASVMLGAELPRRVGQVVFGIVALPAVVVSYRRFSEWLIRQLGFGDPMTGPAVR